MLVQRKTKAAEVIHGQAQTDEVMPAAALEGELAAAFVGQFLDELLAGRDIRGAERRQAGAGARLVQVRKGGRNVTAGVVLVVS